MDKQGLLLVISGPSGAGKSTVLRAVMESRDDMFFSVSATTRPPRPGEQDGHDYFFMEEKAFREMREAGLLLEWAEYAGNCYGTPSAPIRERLMRGQIVVLDIETNGALQVMEQCPDAITVFLSPSSEEESERRLRGRGTESESKIQKRMEIMREEYHFIDRYQYIVVNDGLEEAVKTLAAILVAESARTDRNRHLFTAYRK